MTNNNLNTTIKKASFKNGFKRETGFLIFVAVLILFPFMVNLISGSGLNEGITKYWNGQLIAFFIMAVLAMSYDLLIGYSGILSFGHAAFFGVGAYTTALLITHWGPNFAAKYKITLPGGSDITGIVIFIVAILAAALAALVIGLLFSATSVRLKGAYFAMLTLALAEAIHILAKATDFVKWTGADEGLHGVPVPAWINPTQFRLRFYFIALAFMVISYFVIRRFTNSPVGRIIVATRENEDRMRMIGYNPATYRTITFLVSALFAGLAGAMYSLWNMSATPSMTSAVTTINMLIMVILGGMGTLIGPIIGAGAMQTLGLFLYDWFGARWPLVFGLIFIVIVLFFPYGIVGTFKLRQMDIQRGWQRLIDLFKPKKE
ncbi:MAG: branched-chain amino acid ABC transporter permease [Anaerolineae bacterium]|jgi:branched-chain amino acid transport system permease protein|nr:branched-chain amino acid ABC transporter permease [Anaerolineae bacterium]